MRTAAVLDGDEWVIDGAKNWITPTPRSPTSYVVFAVTDRESRADHRLPRRGRPAGLLGRQARAQARDPRARRPARRVLDGVRVPRANVIGEVGKGMRVALGTLERTRLAPPRRAVGIARARPTTPTTTPGSGSPSVAPINQLQAIGFKLATWRPAAAAARELLYRPARWPTATTPGLASTPRWRRLFASDNAMR